MTNFEFVGTNDNGPFTCVPAALEFRKSIGGEDAIMAYCTELARQGGRLVANKLGTEVIDNASHTNTDCCFTTVKLPINLNKIKIAAEATHKREMEWSEKIRMMPPQHHPQDVQQTEQGQEQPLKPHNYGNVVRDNIIKLLVNEHVTFMAILFYREAWWVRLSAQIYLELEDFRWSAEVLKKVSQRVEMSF